MVAQYEKGLEENPLTFIWLDGQCEPTPSQVRDPYFTWINPNHDFELVCIMYINLLVTLTRQRGMFTNYQNRPHSLKKNKQALFIKFV